MRQGRAYSCMLTQDNGNNVHILQSSSVIIPSPILFKDGNKERENMILCSSADSLLSMDDAHLTRTGSLVSVTLHSKLRRAVLDHVTSHVAFQYVFFIYLSSCIAINNIIGTIKLAHLADICQVSNMAMSTSHTSTFMFYCSNVMSCLYGFHRPSMYHLKMIVISTKQDRYSFSSY